MLGLCKDYVRTMLGRRLYIVIVGLVVLFASCQPDEKCRQSLDVVAGIALKGTAVDSLGEGTAFTSWDSITVQGVGNDSVLYDNKKAVSRVLVPLRIDTNVTAFTLTWHGVDDVVYIKHDNERRFVSMACGCVIYHTIESVWCKGTWIDSVKLVNSAVETVEQDNMQVYVTIGN